MPRSTLRASPTLSVGGRILSKYFKSSDNGETVRARLDGSQLKDITLQPFQEPTRRPGEADRAFKLRRTSLRSKYKRAAEIKARLFQEDPGNFPENWYNHLRAKQDRINTTTSRRREQKDHGDQLAFAVPRKMRLTSSSFASPSQSQHVAPENVDDLGQPAQQQEMLPDQHKLQEVLHSIFGSP
jgi:hypothetical protein